MQHPNYFCFSNTISIGRKIVKTRHQEDHRYNDKRMWPCGHILNRYRWALLKAHYINECSLFADKLLAVLDQQTLGVVVNTLAEHVVNRSVYIGSVNSEVFNS